MKIRIVSTALIALFALSACGRPSTNTPFPETETVPAALGTETLSTDSTLAPSGTMEVPSVQIDAGRVSSALGFQVYGSASDVVGTPSDFVLNFDTNAVDYVLVRVDATGELVAVPWSALVLNTSTAAQNQNSFSYGGGPELLVSASAFNETAMPPLGQSAAGWDADLRGHWGLSMVPQVTESPAAQTITELNGVVLASAFIGRPVLTSDGQTAGNVYDLVIDAQSGQIRYVVLNTSPGGDPGLIAVPVNALAWDEANASLALTVEQTVFIAAPFYTLETFPNTQQPDWDAELRSYWQDSVP